MPKKNKKQIRKNPPKLSKKFSRKRNPRFYSDRYSLLNNLISGLNRNNFKNKYSTTIIFALFFGTIITFYILNTKNLASWGDIYSPKQDMSQTLLYSFTAWYPINMGIPTSMHPFEFFVSLLFIFVKSPFIIQTIVLFLSWIIATLSAFILTKKLGIFSPKFKIIFALLYGFNGFLVNQLGATGLMWSYAFTPLVVLYAYLIIIQNEWKLRNILLLSLTLSAGGIINIQFFITSAIMIAPLFLVKIFLPDRNRVKKMLKSVGSIFLSYFIYLLITAPISIIFFFSFFQNDSAQYLKGESFRSILNPEWYHNYFPTPLHSFLNIFEIGVSNQGRVEYLFGAFLPLFFLILVFYYLFTKHVPKKKDGHPAILLYSIISITIYTIFIALIIYKPDFAERLYQKLFILKAFEQPPKWQYLMVFPSCIVLVFLLDRLVKNRQRLLVPLVCIVLFFAPTRYFFEKVSGARLKNELTSFGGDHYISRVFLDEIGEISEFINKDKRYENQYRTLVLPQEGVVNLMSYYMSPNNLIFPAHKEAANDQIMATIANLSDDKERDPSLGLLADILNIRYIVILKEVDQSKNPSIHYYKGSPGYIVGDPNKFIGQLDKSNVLKKVKNEAKYRIYEILY